MAAGLHEPWREPRSEQHWMVRDSVIVDLRALVTGWQRFAETYREYHGDDAAVAKAIQKCASELDERVKRLFPPTVKGPT